MRTALIKAAEAIIAILRTVESSPNGSGAGVYAADGKATLRAIIIPVDLLRALRQALPTAIETAHFAALAEDISWLRSMRAEYANLVHSIKGSGEDPDNVLMEQYVSSWDEEAHQECLMRTVRAISELEQMFPHAGP